MDSEYYGYETTNEEVVYELGQSDDELASWFVSTSSSATWIYVDVENAPADSFLTVTSTNLQWYHSIHLGKVGNAAFNCKEFDEVSESCISAYSHSIDIDKDTANLTGRVSLVLPINGIGFLHAVNQTMAQIEAQSMIDEQRSTTTWIVEITRDGELVADEGISIQFSLVEHELIDVYEFELDPVQETVYATATLIGCFSLLIVVPLIAYYAGVVKARLDEENRHDEPAPTE